MYRRLSESKEIQTVHEKPAGQITAETVLVHAPRQPPADVIARPASWVGHARPAAWMRHVQCTLTILHRSDVTVTWTHATRDVHIV